MKIYLDYTQEELDRQYEHRHYIPDAEVFIAAHAAESERVRAAANGRFDIPYGPGEDERLDIYLARGDGAAPIVVYFHGGRWAMGSKASNCEAAEMYTAQGVRCVSVNFSLLPKVTMDTLIGQCRDAIQWLWRNAATFGADRDRLFVHGKSSGAHVAAMMAITDWRAAYDAGDRLEAGSPEEVEIRASALHAVERMVEEIRLAGGASTARELDAILWTRGGQLEFKAHPRHRARCAYY